MVNVEREKREGPYKERQKFIEAQCKTVKDLDRLLLAVGIVSCYLSLSCRIEKVMIARRWINDQGRRLLIKPLRD